MLMHILQLFAGAAFIILMFLFVYLGAVVSEEHKQKRRIPLIWESDHPWLIKINNFFNKNNVKDDV